MASRRKKSPKKKKAHRRSSKSLAANKIIARVLIGIVLLVVLFEGAKMFLTGPAPKNIKVQQLLRISGEQKECGRFNSWGIAPVGKKGEFIVADQENGRLLLFNSEGKFLKAWGKQGSGPKDFHEPTGMTTDGNGTAYVIDTWNSYIKGFDDKGNQKVAINISTQGFYGPRGISFDGHNFAVADAGGHRIALVSPDGIIVASWGHMGSGDGEFKGPTSVATDGQGHYLVADTDNHRVQFLDQNGKFVRQIKMLPPVLSVAADQQGRFYVSSGDDNGCVKIFNADGKYQGTLVDESGSVNSLSGLRGLYITKDGVLMGVLGDAAVMYQVPPVTP